MVEPNNITILAVNDNDAIRYSLSRALRGGGYRVIEARNGTETLALAHEDPDLITLDVHLPDMDGFEVCRRLKANPQTAHIPVLHISATVTDTENRCGAWRRPTDTCRNRFRAKSSWQRWDPCCV